MDVYTVRDDQLDPADLEKIVAALKDGAVIAFPTETVYGLGCFPGCQEAVDRIYSIKNRDKKKPFANHISTERMVDELGCIKPSFFDQFKSQYWPGPVSIILKDETGKTEGFRFPDCKPSLQLIDACGGNLLATSANQSDEPSLTEPEKVKQQFDSKIDLMIDLGKPCEYSVDSTVIMELEDGWKIVRAGYKADEIETFLSENAS